jgi:uncharacterized membrane protein YhdT
MRIAGVAGGIAILSFLALEFPRQKPFARRLFLILLGAGAVALASLADPWPTLIEALRRAASYAAFFLALGFLRDAAETSPLVRRSGVDLVEQPPATRTAALACGAHLFAVILSYGAIELFGAMLSRTLKPHDDAGRHASMMAVYRGFSTTTAWSPLNIGMAVVLAAVPEANWLSLVPPGFAFALVALAFAVWLGRAPGPPAARPAIDWPAHARLAGLVVLVFLLAFAVEEAFGVRLVVGVTAVLPGFALGWIALQAKGLAGDRLHVAWSRLRAQIAIRIPTYRAEATVLGGAGFAGVAIAAAFPSALAADLFARAGLPGIVVLAAIAPVMLLLSQLALNPIIAVMLLAAVLPPPAELGVSPTALGLAYLTGWAVSAGMTPMSASAISTARWAGRPGSEVSPYAVTNRWNAGFVAGQMAGAWVVLLLVA